jgi:hypothetical protein
MKAEKFVGILFIGLLFFFTSVLYAQTPSNFKWQDLVPWILAAAAPVKYFSGSVPRLAP